MTIEERGVARNITAAVGDGRLLRVEIGQGHLLLRSTRGGPRGVGRGTVSGESVDQGSVHGYRESYGA